MTNAEATLSSMDEPAPRNEPAPGPLDRFAAAFVDRLNPILVREVRQAVNGKALVITGALALLGTILVALTAAAGGKAVGRGAYVFVYALQVLTPIVLFIVPLQAFLSTRHEVTKGTVEHLLLSRLTPGQIVRGKLAAACIQFALYLAIFAPLIAMTFLLRGVDVPTIAFSIGLAFLFGLGCSALAVACGSLSRWPALFRVLPFAIVIFGLGTLTISAMVGMSEVLFDLTREIFRGNFWEITSGILIPTVAGIVLCGLVGTAALSHPNENRSTGFRIFAVVALVGTFVWMHLALPTKSLSPSGYLRPERMLWNVSAILGGFLFLFPLFAVTEAPKLSPRVRVHVPRNGLLALLSAPFLPGSGRGFLFALLFAATALALPVLFAATGGYDGDKSDVGLALMAWCYIVLYTGLAAFVRRRLGPSTKATWIARAVPIGVLLLAVILPLLFEVVLGASRIGRWEVYRVLDPFTTLDHFDGHPWDVLPGLGLLAFLAIALNVPAMVSAVREVLTASKARRRLDG